MSSEDGGGRGPGSPTLCFAFGKASCDGAVIPAVNKPFPGLLMGTIWQRGASGPPQSRSCFPMPETHQLLGSPSASTGLEPTGNGLERGREGKAPAPVLAACKRDHSEAG